MNEWISVEDNLPDYETSVLVFVKGCGQTQAYVFGDSEISDWDGALLTFETWYNEVANDNIEDGLVTHWMPLPSPPEGENK